MKLLKPLLYLLLIGLLCQCKMLQYADTNTSGPDVGFKNEGGNCFAKCLITDMTELKSTEYAAFTGDESEEDVDLEVKTIVLQEKSSKWVKKKADRNCVSADPNDCLVWCLVEKPEITKEIKILIDTSQTDNYELRKIDYEVTTKQGGFTEWKQVLCAQEVTTAIINQVQESLRANEYYEGENTPQIGARTKAALTRFQKDNQLPVGHLDFETLDVLGVSLE